MQGKIAIEEHFAIPETNGVKNRVASAYWDGLNAKLLDFDNQRIEEMDKGGVGFAIISLNAPAVQGFNDPKEAIEVARRANDALAEQVRRRPDRYAGFAALPLQDPDAAAREFQRCVRDLGFKGALVNGYSNAPDGKTGLYYDAPMYRPFWAEVEKLDVPFYLHPRDPVSLERYAGIPWLVGSAWSFAEETALHALRLLTGGLFDEHPKLKLILGHLGERIPFDLWRLDHRLKYRHDCPAKRKVSDYFRENVWVTTSGNFSTQALMECMLQIGSDRILFSVDYPYEETQPGTDWFDAAEISEADRVKIGRGNAQALFNLRAV